MIGAELITHFLEKKKIADLFGYPGGTLTYLMDALATSKTVNMHLAYHEQGAAFCACGYAQIKNSVGVAFATSGPGATNLLTGVCNAWFDSIPVLFITGQVSSAESKGSSRLRQRGFQETDIVAMVEKVTKYAKYVNSVDVLAEELEKSFQIANSGRRGPVLLDIPIDVMKSQVTSIKISDYDNYSEKVSFSADRQVGQVQELLNHATRPCLLLGNGVHLLPKNEIKALMQHLSIPTVTSMPAVDLLKYDERMNFGFLGAYGNRAANILVEGCDLLLAIGTRLDMRQTGTNIAWFAPKAKLVRFDIDKAELNNRIKEDEVDICIDIEHILSFCKKLNLPREQYRIWSEQCIKVKHVLLDMDKQETTSLVKHISEMIDEDCIVTTDVGQNQVWVAQSFCVRGQRILFSSGHGAMGYSLPAAIGAAYASGKKVFCFCGDGGIQMNIQELQMLARDKISVKVIVLNNHSLGMIRHFQELYFKNEYPLTCKEHGYTVPDFLDIATAYKIESMQYRGEQDDEELIGLLRSDNCALIEVCFSDITYVKPKSTFNSPLSLQEPLLPKNIVDEIEKVMY